MKIACFHLMPYRDLDDDFEKKYPSSWFSLPFSEVADRQKVSRVLCLSPERGQIRGGGGELQ